MKVIIVERQAAFGHIINQLVAFTVPSTSVAAGTLPFSTVFFGRFECVFATGASLLPGCHGNGDGLRRLPTPVSSVAVYVKAPANFI
ncbi:hypothetical protein O9993_05575 [Vibrio lentus]|nr:hypothetical protein [Vibrio lentus]